MEIFKSYDIRGLYPSELNEENAFEIGRAIATRLKGKKIFLNYDNRVGSINIREAFTSGLLKSGATVYELGLGPVMVVALASLKENSCGICISASHNPKEYTGILTYVDGVTLTPESIKKIYDSKRFLDKRGKLIPYSYDQEYIDCTTNGLSLSGLRVGLDSMGGATTYIAPHIFEKAGARPFSLRSSPSSDFYGQTPEPSIEGSKNLGRLVKKERLDFGVQLDADGDRSLIVDERGKGLDPMAMAMILIKYMKYKKTVATLACSSLLERYTKITYVKTGRPNVEVELKKGGYDFGVETASHTYFGRYYPFSDGILTGLIIGKVLKVTGKRLSELVKEFPKIYYENITLHFDSAKRIGAKMQEITKNLKQYKNRIDIDGIKIIFEDGFMLFRPSNTEPVIRVYYTGHTKAAFERIGSLAKKVIK